MNNGLIFDIRRFSVHDGPGIRTTVFFKGCPLRCWWCHNPESQEPFVEESGKNLILDGERYYRKVLAGRFMTAGEVMNEILKDRIFFEESGGGVTFSGGEPLMQPGFLISVLESCKKNNIHTAIDTCGLADNKVFRDILPLTDLFLYDIKIVDGDLHREFTGESNELILSNLKFLAGQGKKTIIRFPVIPGFTDSRKNIDSIKKLLKNIHLSDQDISLLPYHNLSGRKYERFGKQNRVKEINEPRNGVLSVLKKEFEEIGMNVTIGG